jgi:hypothetical protein
MLYPLIAFTLFAAVLIVRGGIGGHRHAMAKRHRLLDEAGALLGLPTMRLAPDQFPIVTGQIEDGRNVVVELIADTMVTRRLPQLWLTVKLMEKTDGDGPALGALARPTGSEYYSRVHGFPEWMPPPEMDVALLMRGDGRATAEQSAKVGLFFQRLFADLRVKEAVITPKSAHVIFQLSQGSRAAHALLRQAQFSVDTVPADTIRQAIALAAELSTVLTKPDQSSLYEAA